MKHEYRVVHMMVFMSILLLLCGACVSTPPKTTSAGAVTTTTLAAKEGKPVPTTPASSTTTTVKKAVTPAISDTVVLLQGQQSGLREAGTSIIRTQGEFASIWAKLSSGTTPPSIDFNRYAIALAQAGEKKTGGYSVILTDTQRQPNGDTRLIFHVNEPGKMAMTTQALTTPFILVRVSVKSASAPVFAEIQ